MSAPPRLSKYMMKMDSMDALARTHSKRRAREDGKPWYIFYPDAKTVFARDMLSFCALLFSFVVVPFEPQVAEQREAFDQPDSLQATGGPAGMNDDPGPSAGARLWW